MALGGICGSLLGGYALDNLHIDMIFFLFSVLPTIQLLSCGFVQESPLGSKTLPELSTSNGSDLVNLKVSEEDKFSADKSKTSISRRKKGQNNSKRRAVVSSKFQTPEKDGSLASQWFQSLKIATYTLFRAFRQPMILR